MATNCPHKASTFAARSAREPSFSRNKVTTSGGTEVRWAWRRRRASSRSSVSLVSLVRDPLNETLDLDLVGRSDEHDAVEAGAPASLGRVLRREDQRRLDDDDGMGLRACDPGDVLGLRGDDRGVNDRVELFDARVVRVEGELRDGVTVEGAVGLRMAGPKRSTIWVNGGLPGCIMARPISSEERTIAPCAASICATVDLPLPSSPVRPTRSMR